MRRLGTKVRRLRKQACLSQTQLAVELGLSEHSKGYISEIESGKKTPPTEMIVLLAELFKVTTDYLLRDEIGETDE